MNQHHLHYSRQAFWCEFYACWRVCFHTQLIPRPVRSISWRVCSHTSLISHPMPSFSCPLFDTLGHSEQVEFLFLIAHVWMWPHFHFSFLPFSLPFSFPSFSRPGLAHFFCNEPVSKYFRPCRPYHLCHNCLPLPLAYKTLKAARQYINKWTWLSSNKTVFAKTHIKLDLTHEP